MRELVDSSESISEPLRWFLARNNSSSLTGDSFKSRNSFTIRSITWPTVSRAVPAYTVIIPASEYGVNSRSEEHTSELQSHSDLVCRLLLEKKKVKTKWYENTER